MNDLDQQYQNKTLPEDMYYIEYSPIMHEGVQQTNGGIVEKYLCRENWHPLYDGEHILAKVPSYGEYDNIIKCYEHAHKQNEILRELLKSARVYVETDTQDYEDRTPTKGDIEAAKKLLAKINEALK